MNIFQLSISTFIFGITLLLGTTAVIASRFVITTVTGLTKTEAVSESVAIAAVEPEKGVELPDLRHEPPPTPDDFDPSGGYSMISEDVNTAFVDIASLDITAREYWKTNGTYLNRPIVPHGNLNGTKTRFALTKISVGMREISFETSTEGGVSYQFVGHFPASSEFITCEGCEHPADLKGTLRKFKDGYVVGELDAKFYAYGRWNVGP